MLTREDWTSFRTISGLTQKAGVPANRLRRLVVKELVDNALDAAGTCKLSMLRDGTYVIEDKGPGIPGTPDEIAELFSVKRPLQTSKLWRLPTRGALGNGIRVAVGAVLASKGRLRVKSRDTLYRLMPQDDGTTRMKCRQIKHPTGTRIEIKLGTGIPEDANAILWGLDAIRMNVGETYAGRTSAHWYDSDAFFELCQAWHRPCRDLVEHFDGCTGAKAGKIAEDFKGRAASSLTRSEAARLLTCIRENTEPVSVKRLGTMGKETITPAGYARQTDTVRHQPGQEGLPAAIPYIVECWARSEADGIEVFINRTPITGRMYVQRQTDKTKLGIFGCGLNNAVRVGRAPVTLTISIIIPFMPITSDGKEPDLSRFRTSLLEAIEAATRKLRRTSTSGRSITLKDTILAHLDDAIEKTSGKGRHRFSQRQLFYAVRPYVLQAHRTELEFNYFTQVIGAYEADHEDIKGMTRDPRGILYHPHIGQEIPIGTLAVEQYERPAWMFNKILYCEKEGLFPILKDTRWPERHDCALLTSKGFASRAARDLLDLLGDTDEPISFYCIHDADAAGTMIYQSLQQETRSRPGRTVQVVNLGLEPEEALEMRLEPERFTGKGKRPTAGYVSAYWRTWLQTHRVELNAMTTPQFLAWLDSKMDDADLGKVIPPDEVLHAELKREVRTRVKQQITERILQDAGLDDRIDEACLRIDPVIDSMNGRLVEIVEATLEDEPTEHWTTPIKTEADHLVEV